MVLARSDVVHGRLGGKLEDAIRILSHTVEREKIARLLRGDFSFMNMYTYLRLSLLKLCICPCNWLLCEIFYIFTKAALYFREGYSREAPI